MERTIDESRMCQKKNIQFFLLIFLFNFRYFFSQTLSIYAFLWLFGLFNSLLPWKQRSDSPFKSRLSPQFRLKTLAENNWMFGPKYCNLELRRRTIFPVPCARLKLAALLLSCLMHIQIGVFLNWKKKWFVTTENFRQRQLRAC